MANIILPIDLGYSAGKMLFNNKIYKYQSSINYAGAVNLEYGDGTQVYEFEGEKYTVGQPSETSFVTTNFEFITKFGPLMMYHATKLLGLDLKNNTIVFSTGLAISDWPRRQEFVERIASVKEINGEAVDFKIGSIIPQGAGVYYDFLNDNPEVAEQNVFVIDGGYNTVNTMSFKKGVPDRNKAAAHIGAGVSTIIKEFTKYMELTYNLPFSEQEALEKFIEKRFVYKGIEQKQVTEKIDELKKQFIQQLFKSILVSEQKLLNTSDVVIIGGGLAYFLNVPMPSNARFVKDPYEFSNVRGYNIVAASTIK